MAVPTFVDRVVLHIAAGRGGNGVASVHREKFKPLGGPDGGNGGPGGSVILRVDPDVTTLVDYHHSPTRKAEHGGHGAGGHRNGSHGSDLVLAVPDGTVVTTEDGDVVADLVGAGTEIVVASGGRGGLGNAALASSKRKAPGFALLGEPGDELTIALELKVVADIGLVGFPSAGKSSLIAAMSRARPKIADYPFTTLVPNLGVVTAGDTTFTVADVPGLIEGASEGRGLGHDFLRHIERCAALVHVLDMATMEPGRDPVSDLDVIETELSRYGGLEDRPRLVALNKIDVPDGRDMADIVIDELRGPGAHRGAGLRREPRGAPGARLRHGARSCSAARADRPVVEPQAHRDPPAGRLGDPRLHRHRDPGGLAGAGREARAVGQADRLLQRRGRRLPRRPAEPARRRGPAAGDGRRRGRRRGHRRARRTRSSSTSSRWSTPARACSAAGAARTTVSRSSVPRSAGAGRSTRRTPSGTRARRAPTSRAGRRAAGPDGHDDDATRSRRATGTRTWSGARTTQVRRVGDPRGRRPGARRVVVKVGSSSLTTAEGGIDPDRVSALVDTLAAARARGAEVVLVSSGAIAAGLAPLGLKRRPRDLATQQAAASVGQGLLVHRYTEELARHGITTGQVLLTVDDVTRRSHHQNAYRTFARLLEMGVLPIVNENDTVATTEIRFGDNDRLAALAAHLVHADLLLLLSDVDGLYTGKPSDPASRMLSDVRGDADLAAGAGRQGRRRRRRHRRDADQDRGGPDRHRRRRAGRADVRRTRRCRAGGGAGRHDVPPDRPPPAHPAALAGARHRGQGAAVPRRRRGARRRRAPRVPAAGRDHPGHGLVQRR